MKKGKILLFFVATILIFVFTNPLLLLYEKIVGYKLYGGFGVLSGRSYLEGFFMSYAFFITLFSVIFLEKKKYVFLLISLGFVCALHVLFQVWDSLIIFVSTAIASFLLAEIILFIKKQITNKK